VCAFIGDSRDGWGLEIFCGANRGCAVIIAVVIIVQPSRPEVRTSVIVYILSDINIICGSFDEVVLVGIEIVVLAVLLLLLSLALNDKG